MAIPLELPRPRFTGDALLRRLDGLRPRLRANGAAAAFLRDRWGVAGLAIIAVLVALALAAPALYPGDPLASVAQALLAPGEDAGHPLGTDTLGRDIAAGIAHGGRVSLTIGILAACVSIAIGLAVGMTAGYRGGRVDDALMRLTELFQTTPSFLLAIVIVSLGGPSVGIIVVAIGLGSFPMVARLVRAEFRALKASDFVAAARSQGYGDRRIIFQEILPNTLPPVIVASSVLIASAILTESGLSFLGLGDPNKVSWGSMVGAGREMLQSAPSLTAIPGVMIMLAILALNLIGDALNEALNPRLRATR